MMGDVTTLADRNGFPPKLTAAGDVLCKEIWEALEKAAESGMPTSMLIGFLEMAKLEVLQSVIEVDGEPA